MIGCWLVEKKKNCNKKLVSFLFKLISFLHFYFFLPYDSIGTNVGVRAVDQKHVGACGSILHDGGVKGR